MTIASKIGQKIISDVLVPEALKLLNQVIENAEKGGSAKEQVRQARIALDAQVSERATREGVRAAIKGIRKARK